MDHGQDDPLIDSSLDREIESALAVDPSPEFLARIRTRLAEEPAPSSWRWNWGFAVGAAAAVALIAVVAAPWMRSTLIEVPRQARSLADVTFEPAPASVPLTPDTTKKEPRGERRVRQPLVRSVRLQPEQTDAPPFREVLVSADEARAFNAIVAQVGAGRLPEFPQAAGLSEPPAPIEVPELVIEPLRTAQLDAETGERP